MDDDITVVARLLADYDIGSELGRGQYGVVWEARHRHLGRRVAVKQLVHLAPEQGDESSARFRREARILAGLDHPHVVTIYDYREDGDVRVIVMEHLDGGTLADRLKAGMDGPEQLAAVVAAATGLHSVHGSGVLHRDVKPENLMFDGRRALKVTDFGVARTDSGIGATTTAVGVSFVGQFFGTPAYVSPEQAEAAFTGRPVPIGPAADQYGLAAVYFEMLTGQLTHDPEGGFLGICNRRMAEPAPRVRDLAPDVHPAIDDVIARALRRDPDDRHADVEAFAVALVRAGNQAFGQGWLDGSKVELRDTGRAWREAQAGTPPPPPAPPVAPPDPHRGAAGATTALDRGRPAPGQGPPIAETQGPATPLPRVPVVVPIPASPPGPAPTPPPGAATAPPAMPGFVPPRGLTPPPVAPVGPPSAPPPTPPPPWDVATARQPDATPPPSPPAPSADAEPPRRRRLPVLLAVVAVAIALVAAGVAVAIVGRGDGEGSADGTTTSTTAPNPAAGAARMTEVWSAPTGGDVFSSPTVDGDRVVVGSEDGSVYALDAESGEQLWATPTGAKVQSSPAVSGDRYVVGSFDGKVYALGRADGAEAWSRDLGFQIAASPAVAGDLVIAAADRVYGLAAADGAVRWQYPPAGEDSTTTYVGSPAVDGSTVVVAGTDGTVTALDAASGTRRWVVGDDDPAGEEGPAEDLLASPRIADGTVVIGDQGGTLWMLAVDDGAVLQQVEVGSAVRSSAAIVDGTAYVGTAGGDLVAVDADGEVVWTSPLSDSVDSSPVVVGDVVVVGSNDANVYAVAVSDGAVVSTFRTGGPVLSSPRALGDGVVVGSSDDAVRALTGLDG